MMRTIVLASVLLLLSLSAHAQNYLTREQLANVGLTASTSDPAGVSCTATTPPTYRVFVSGSSLVNYTCVDPGGGFVWTAVSGAAADAISLRGVSICAGISPNDDDILKYDTGSGCFQVETDAGGVGVTDGDKSDITVSSSGTVWSIDAGVVGDTEAAAELARDVEVEKVFDVRNYGAVCSGSGDYSSEIQATIDAAESAGGGIVTADGVCNYATTLTYSDDILFRGSGIVQAILNYTGTGTALQPVSPGTDYSRVQFDNIRISSSTGTATLGIDFDCVDRTYLNNVSISGFTTGIDAHCSGAGTAVYHNWHGLVVDGATTGIYLRDTSNSVNIHGSKFTAPDSYGIRIASTNNVNIEGSWFEDAVGDPDADDVGIYVESGGSSIKISGNRFERLNKPVDIVAGASGVSMKYNHTSGNTSTIVANDAGTGTRAIYWDGSNWVRYPANSVSAADLDASGVESELEAVMDLQDMQGAVTDGQVPDTITIDGGLIEQATTLKVNINNSLTIPSATTGNAGYAYFRNPGGVAAELQWCAQEADGSFFGDDRDTTCFVAGAHTVDTTCAGTACDLRDSGAISCAYAGTDSNGGFICAATPPGDMTAAVYDGADGNNSVEDAEQLATAATAQPYAYLTADQICFDPDVDGDCDSGYDAVTGWFQPAVPVPTKEYTDSDTVDEDVSASDTVNCTGTATGAENCDRSWTAQIDGADTTIASFDSDSDDTGTATNPTITLGSASIAVEIPDDTVDIADLNATGTATGSTALCGDGTWGTCGLSGGSSLPVTDTTSIVEGSVDATKEVRIEADGITTGTVRVWTAPDQDLDLTPGTGDFATAAEGDLAATSHQQGGTDVPVADGGTGASTAADARTNLGVDAAGTDNSTDVTLAGTPDYITIAGQVITRNAVDLSSDVTGELPDANVSDTLTVGSGGSVDDGAIPSGVTRDTEWDTLAEINAATTDDDAAGLAANNTLSGNNTLTGDNSLDGQVDLDGKTIFLDDSTATLAAVHTAVNTAGVSTVYLAAGATYESATTGNTLAHIEIPSGVTLDCQGALLQQTEDLAGTETDAVVSTADAADRVTVRNCIVDGGFTSGATWTGGASDERMGIRCEACTNSTFENNYVRDTYHAGFYAKKFTNLSVADSRFEGVGNTGSGGAKYSCVYLFGDDSTTADGARVHDVYCKDTGSGFNTRRDSTADTLKNIEFSDITCEGCDTSAIVRGTENVTIDHLVTLNSGGIRTEDTTGYGHVDGAIGTVVQNSVLRDVTGTNPAFLINDYTDGFEVKDTTVVGTVGPGFGIRNPGRGIVIDGVNVSDCGTTCFQINSAEDSGALPQEKLVIRDSSFIGSDWVDRTDATYYPCMEMFSTSTQTNLVMEGVRIQDCTDTGIKNLDARFASIRDITIDGAPSKFFGQMTESAANALTCDADATNWQVITTDGSAFDDCTFSATTGSTEAVCFCDGSSWVRMENTNRDGIEFESGSTNVQLSDVNISNLWRDGGSSNLAHAQGIVLNGADEFTIEDVICETNPDFTPVAFSECIDAGATDGSRIDNVTCNGLTRSDGIGGTNLRCVDLSSATNTIRASEIPVPILWAAPDTADEFTIRLPNFSGAINRIDCEAYGGTSFTINVCDGEDRGDDTCTTSILDATASTTLTCTTSGASDTALNASAVYFDAQDKVTLVITAVSGAVDQGEVILYVSED